MGELGVTEWENLGYRDSDMMGRPGNLDPRNFWQADLDDAARRLVWLIRQYKPDVVTTYNAYGGYGHPDHIRVHDVAIRAVPRAGDAAWYPEQLEGEGAVEPWAPRKFYEQATPESVRRAMNARLAELGVDSFWLPPPDATPEQLAEYEERMSKMLAPDDTITTWVDIGDVLDLKWAAIQKHVTQINMDFPFMKLGLDGWREFWGRETFILRESTVETDKPESDVFAGLELSPAYVTRAEQALRGVVDLAHDDPAVARRVEEVRLGLVEDDVRPHPGLDELGAVERQLERHALHRRLGPGLVEDEVAERVPDRPALVDLERARPVGVVADDHVGAGVDRGSGQRLLTFERRRVVLGAPVREHDHDLGAGVARLLDVRDDVLLGERRAARRVRPGPVAGRDRVVADDPDLDAVRPRGSSAGGPIGRPCRRRRT